uniref:Uncharacterized protein n=1 Tax=Anguilla anguilla TaxID=7936 RepID=A0A0E9VP58_ANGAN
MEESMLSFTKGRDLQRPSLENMQTFESSLF